MDLDPHETDSETEGAPGATGPPPPPRRPPNPWWLPPFLGRMPAIEDRHVTLLGLVGLALLFEQYDLSMLTSALKHIATDLGMTESELGGYLSLVRLGAIPAFLMVPLADRLGRRRLFLAAVVGSSLGTLATAFAQTPEQFAILQMGTRTFLTAGMAVAFVMITEELPAEHRGWGTGILGLLGSLGVGLGALLFALVDVLPFGWRALYAAGVVPLLLVPRMRRGIAETARFQRHAEAEAARGARASPVLAWLQTLVALARTYPGRAALIAGIAGFDALGKVAVFQFTGYHVLEAKGWPPYWYSALVIGGGLVGVTGNLVAGRLGDRIGRRIVGFAVMGGFPLSAGLFYLGPEWGIPPAWIALAFLATASSVIQRALAAELFPTSHRGTAVGWLTLVETMAAATGLALVGAGSQQPGDLAQTTSLLSCVVALGGLLLFLLPETRRRELEEISDDADEAGPGEAPRPGPG